MEKYIVKNTFVGTTKEEIKQSFNEQLSKLISEMREKDLQQLSKAV